VQVSGLLGFPKIQQQEMHLKFINAKVNLSFFPFFQTSYEHYKRKHNKKLNWEPEINIFNKGLLMNFKELLCTKPCPSEIDLRAFVEEYSPLQGPPSGTQACREATPLEHESQMTVEDDNIAMSSISRSELYEEMVQSSGEWGHESNDTGSNCRKREFAITIGSETEIAGSDRDLEPNINEPIKGQ
jgi:hypothetical protein